MPIPGDNGRPREERDAQNRRISEVANTDAYVKKELILNKPAPKVKSIFGDVS